MSLLSANSATSGMSFRSVRSDASKPSTAGRSQLHWQKFRSGVLSPHHIRILPSMPSQNMPETILAHIDINRTNLEKFSAQRNSFRGQVSSGRGFAASAFFPSDVLPPMSEQSLLTRCMVPSYSAEALPERMTSKAQSKSDLITPRPGLGYGFHSKAFTSFELEKLPRYLSTTGTPLQADFTACAAVSALYAPFMSFERVFSGSEYGVDLASNQCAVDGAWCVRALQMLYAAATGEAVKTQFEQPVSFSCCVDNDIAILNFHWIDHAQTYCMSPIVKFNLSLDKDFDQFLLWTEAVGQWAASQLLPEVKRAIGLLSNNVSPKVKEEKATTEPVSTTQQQCEQALPSVKTDFDYTEWQLQSNLYSPSLSSTASWGSPMIDEAVFDKLNYPRVQRSRSICADPNIARVRFPPSPVMPVRSCLTSKPEASVPAIARENSPPLPAYEKNTELLVKKRLSHAMGEIEDLQMQMLQLKKDITSSVSCLQTEMAGMRKAMTSMVRKEKSGPSKKSPLRISAPTSILQAENRQDIPKGLKPLITTPTEFRPVSIHSRKISRTPSGLSNVLTPLDTSVSAVVSVRSPKSADSNRSPTSADSDLLSPEDRLLPAIPATPSNVPSPSLAPSDAISCISCLSCRRAALKTIVPAASPQSPVLQSITSYKQRTGFMTMVMQIIVVLCLVDYVVLLVGRLHSPAVMDFITETVKSVHL
ncbi:hypothetical protein LTR70_003147 [Exophiala xenobiotica]|uniref:DUF7924 domain-containing protein n=1 Tax=Lithohypha guttulata TaxID=1690604 RepID=A0ABR0KH08_9EURO|nr:hypothetical protein LTR24_002621 [Lithohypha guttulata]KAK5323858.1 hypothetical protein LTR70_003147 [Exophiala xenobiotica]